MEPIRHMLRNAASIVSDSSGAADCDQVSFTVTTKQRGS